MFYVYTQIPLHQIICIQESILHLLCFDFVVAFHLHLYWSSIRSYLQNDIVDYNLWYANQNTIQDWWALQGLQILFFGFFDSQYSIEVCLIPMQYYYLMQF